MTHQDNLLSRTATFSLFCGAVVALAITWEVEFLELDYEEMLQTVSQ